MRAAPLSPAAAFVRACLVLAVLGLGSADMAHAQAVDSAQVEQTDADTTHADTTHAENDHADDHGEGDDDHGEAGAHGDDHGGGHGHGPPPPLWLCIPFAVLLLLIATGPIFFPHHWHHHYPKYAVALGTLVMAYFLVQGDSLPLIHAAEEYFSFIALLASLFIASGGILIKTDFAGTPKANAGLLFVGAVISNVIGTTGASMLLIRPYMRLNKGRIKPYHIIFFIFIVSNVGGALTPIGDPPLFLGFLRGVPFFWTATQIWYVWLPTILILLAVFYAFDVRNKTHAEREDHMEDADQPTQAGVEAAGFDVPGTAKIRIQGTKNFAWLAVVIASVFIDPNIIPAMQGTVLDLSGTFHFPFGIREVIMFGVCYLAYATADKDALQGNDFNFEPIREVAWLFVGIFAYIISNWNALARIVFESAKARTRGSFEVKAPSLKIGCPKRLVVAIGTTSPVSASAALKSRTILSRSEALEPNGTRSSSCRLTPCAPQYARPRTRSQGSRASRTGAPNGSRPGFPTVQRPKVKRLSGRGV